MAARSWHKGLVLLITVLGVVGMSVFFLLMHETDLDNRVDFALLNQTGERTTQQDLAGKYLLVFFGFTSCSEICPTQMGRLSTVLTALDEAGYRNRVTPVFVTVDPERDTVERISNYLQSFHRDFVGLTGSRAALEHAAQRFNTLLGQPSDSVAPGYQLAHSSVVYVVDPSSQLVDYISSDVETDLMIQRIQAFL